MTEPRWLGHESAFAKLTLYLHIVGRRPDGYHLLESEMVSLDLVDTLSFREGNGIEVVGQATKAVPATPDNLVSRALCLAGTTAWVRLHKRIPAGAGLGGGSADAAAAYRWAGGGDAQALAAVGADVPFCLTGGRARVSGIGDVLQPLPFREQIFTLLIPPFPVATADVYRTFDVLAGSSSTSAGETSAEKACNHEKASNHLEQAAVLVEPRLKEWRDKLANASGMAPMLAGSGSTWFVEGAVPTPPADVVGDGRWIVARATEAIPLH